MSGAKLPSYTHNTNQDQLEHLNGPLRLLEKEIERAMEKNKAGTSCVAVGSGLTALFED